MENNYGSPSSSSSTYNNAYQYPHLAPPQPYPPQQYPPQPPPSTSNPYNNPNPRQNYAYHHTSSNSFSYLQPPPSPYPHPLSLNSHSGPLNYYQQQPPLPNPYPYPGGQHQPRPQPQPQYQPRPQPQPQYQPQHQHQHQPQHQPQHQHQHQPQHQPQHQHQPHLSSHLSLQHNSSAQYGSSNYQYQQPGIYPHSETYPNVPPRAHSFVGHHRHESLDSGETEFSQKKESVHDNTPVSYPSIYPPLNDRLGNLHISESRPSAPASPLIPVASTPGVVRFPPIYHSVSAKYENHTGFYPSPNNSFSHTSHTAYGHASSFNGSQSSQKLQIVPSKTSLKVLLLHGSLDIVVHAAKNLPNMDMFHKTLGDVFAKLPGNVSSKIEGHIPTKITSDPYVSISISRAVIGRTYVISNSENPVWNQHFNVPVAHNAAEVHFIVKDDDIVGSQLIGVVAIPVEKLYCGEKIEGTFPILNPSGKPCKPGAVLTVSIQFTSIEQLSIYHNGVGAGPDYEGVSGTYFPLRRGGKVTLYQDAHVPDGSLPNIKLDQEMDYVHGKCWYDIFDAIRTARRLVYITGWSVWHKVRLVRDDAGKAGESTLGDLLKAKSQEGVRVLLLVWDDPTSRNILGYKIDGVMATHDEETRRFFKKSSVQVLLCPRSAGKRHSWMKQKEVGTIYTHHQKTVIVDSDAGNNKRKITAFVGGLDLCDGRYDTPEHPLFKTLQTVHKDDFHNPTFTGNLMGSPREPWHDLHSKIDGPAAYDLLTNFEQRWFKASKPQGLKKLKTSYDDAILRIDRIPDIIGMSDLPDLGDNDPEGWHVQIFRSIDSNSVKGFPKDPKEATSKNLVCGKNVLIDMSIHTAYVKAIRSAQHFIYIENQYFIGSSYNWSSYKDLGANNLIPMEIALKIAEKIKAHERFAAYIVVPMWPEGVPTGAATQRILFWQHKTMQMMYETIYKALVEVGLEEAFVPQDFLNFFCLGNREVDDGSNNLIIGSPTAANGPLVNTQKSRRFMIYVHSKGMIVDDEYVILGSANINQRSMEGTRDTEIAMGAYQPHYTWARKLSNPLGQIHGYRMSLWAEHTGTIEQCFTQPETIDCVKRVRTMGEINWKQFASDDVTEMRGHLLKYPVEVDRKGKVHSLPGYESFPDVGGNIIGSFTAIKENLTI